MNWTRFSQDCSRFTRGFVARKLPAAGSAIREDGKITALKTLQVNNVGDGCLIRIETIQQTLIGQDPRAIERHFYRMSALQYSFGAHIPRSAGSISRYGTSPERFQTNRSIDFSA